MSPSLKILIPIEPVQQTMIDVGELFELVSIVLVLFK